jgi:hypothetical protein
LWTDNYLEYGSDLGKTARTPIRDFSVAGLDLRAEPIVFTVTTKLPLSRKSIQLIIAKTFEQQQLLNAFQVKF